MKKESNQILLPIVLAIALALRLSGTNHGFPFIFHPDEPAVIRTALELRFYLNPGHFDWPHLYMYLNYFIYMFFAGARNGLEFLNLKQTVSSMLPIVWNDELIFYLVTRILSAVLGALTVIPVYLAGRDSFGKRVGIIGALAFALMPFHVRHSHYALIDVPMVFFAAWGMFYALKILQRRDTGDYAGAGFYTGLAASTKYHGGLVSLNVVLAHVLRTIRNKEKLLSLGSLSVITIAGVTAIIGFLMGTPYAVLDYQTFLRTDGPKGALWQFQNVGGSPLAKSIPEFFRKMVFKVSDDTGYVILAAFFVVIGILLYRKLVKKAHSENATLVYLVLCTLFFLFYISGFSRSRSHYYMIAYPYLAVVFAYLVSLLLSKVQKHKIFGALLFLVIFAPLVLLSTKQTFEFTNSDTRVQLYRWMTVNLTKNDTVFYNKATLSPVIEKFPNLKKKGNIRIGDVSEGFLILAEEGSCHCFDYPVAQYQAKLKKLLEIDNSYNLGPKIQIYSYNK